jgi:anion transporter
MARTEDAAAPPALAAAIPLQPSFAKRFGLPLGVVAMVGILLLPTPEGLPVAGQRMLGIFAFAVIVWITEAVSYPVSAAAVMTLMAFLLGSAPDLADPKAVMGTAKGLTMALGGFNSSALGLVGGALFLAAAMMQTGLDRRIALRVLSLIGARTRRVLAGIMLVGFILSLFVPSGTARATCVIPIILGIIAALGVDRKSHFAGLMMITMARGEGLWQAGSKTGAAQNMIALGFIEKTFGRTITWVDWFLAAAPFTLLMAVATYYLMVKMMPPEIEEVAGGRQSLADALARLGPMGRDEKKLLAVSVLLLSFWATENVLHPFDTGSTTVAAVALLLLPGIGVMTWRQAQANIPWDTLMLFGASIGLGTALLSTKAAAWLARRIVAGFGLETLGPLAVVAVLAAFLIVIHLGFASASALASTMIPIVIATIQGVKTPGLNPVGLTMILQYTVSFGFILPVNATQNVLAYGTGTFEARDFIRTGIVQTIIAYALILLLSATYWRWLGLS